MNLILKEVVDGESRKVNQKVARQGRDWDCSDDVPFGERSLVS